jgi:hypothetical protein
VCGSTSGTKLGHDYAAATCTAPKKCKRCGVTLGVAPGHKFTAPTCTKPKTCTVCGITSGYTLAHNYTTATCTTPKQCKDCGFIVEYAKGHVFSNGSCVNCGVPDNIDQRKKLASYIMNNATEVRLGVAYDIKRTYTTEDRYFVFSFQYHTDTQEFLIRVTPLDRRASTTDVSNYLTIRIPLNSNNIELEYVYYSKSYYSRINIEGLKTTNIKNIVKGQTLGFGTFTGTSDHSTHEKLAYQLKDILIPAIDTYLYNGAAADLGFTNFW